MPSSLPGQIHQAENQAADDRRERPGGARDQRIAMVLQRQTADPAEVDVRDAPRPMRRSQSSSMFVPLSRKLRTVSSIRATFQASTTLVSKACEPEMATISSALRPRSGAIRP